MFFNAMPVKNFEKVIKATPKELEDIVSYYICYIPTSRVVKKIKFGKLNLFPDYIQRLEFMYNAFASSAKRLKNKKENDYNAHKLIEKLGITVCPYCNRNFINNIKTVKTKTRTSEIDHFYPKSIFPFFAVSFFNLIPSCKVCNKIKLANNIKILNPYDKRFDTNKIIKFSQQITGTQFYYKTEDIKLEIKYKSENKTAEQLAKNSIDVFKLEDLYNNHKDIALEILQKQYMYSVDYLETLFKQYEGTLFKNMEQLKGIIFGNYISDDEIHKRPLAKFTKDILEDLE